MPFPCETGGSGLEWVLSIFRTQPLRAARSILEHAAFDNAPAKRKVRGKTQTVGLHPGDRLEASGGLRFEEAHERTGQRLAALLFQSRCHAIAPRAINEQLTLFSSSRFLFGKKRTPSSRLDKASRTRGLAGVGAASPPHSSSRSATSAQRAAAGAARTRTLGRVEHSASVRAVTAFRDMYRRAVTWRRSYFDDCSEKNGYFSYRFCWHSVDRIPPRHCF